MAYEIVGFQGATRQQGSSVENITGQTFQTREQAQQYILQETKRSGMPYEERFASSFGRRFGYGNAEIRETEQPTPLTYTSQPLSASKEAERRESKTLQQKRLAEQGIQKAAEGKQVSGSERSAISRFTQGKTPEQAAQEAIQKYEEEESKRPTTSQEFQQSLFSRQIESQKLEIQGSLFGRQISKQIESGDLETAGDVVRRTRELPTQFQSFETQGDIAKTSDDYFKSKPVEISNTESQSKFFTAQAKSKNEYLKAGFEQETKFSESKLKFSTFTAKIKSGFAGANKYVSENLIKPIYEKRDKSLFNKKEGVSLFAAFTKDKKEPEFAQRMDLRSEGFKTGASQYVLNKPVSVALIGASSVPIGFGAVALSSVGTKTATALDLGGKGLLGVYGTTVAVKTYKAETPFEQGKILGEESVKTAAFVSGGLVGADVALRGGFIPSPSALPTLSGSKIALQGKSKGEEVILYRGLSVIQPSTGRGFDIAGFGQGKFSVGTPSLKLEGIKESQFTLGSLANPTLRRSAIKSENFETQQQKELFTGVVDVAKQTYKAPSETLKTLEKPESFKTEEGYAYYIGELGKQKTFLGKSATKNYGSNIYKTEIEAQTRASGDVDTQFFGSEQRVAQFAESKAKTLNVQFKDPSFYKKEEPFLIQTNVEGRSHKGDIHPFDQSIEGQEAPESFYGIPYLTETATKRTATGETAEGFKLAFGGLGKASSVATLRVKEGKFSVGPEEHRLKDVGDFFVYQEQLLKNQKSSFDIAPLKKTAKDVFPDAFKTKIEAKPLSPSIKRNLEISKTSLSPSLSKSSSRSVVSSFSPSRSLSRSPSKSISPSISPSRSPSISPSPSSSLSASPSKSPSRSPSPSKSLSKSPSPSRSVSASPSPSPSPSLSPSVSLRPSITPNPPLIPRFRINRKIQGFGKSTGIKTQRKFKGVPTISTVLGGYGTKLTKAQVSGKAFISPFQTRRV